MSAILAKLVCFSIFFLVVIRGEGATTGATLSAPSSEVALCLRLGMPSPLNVAEPGSYELVETSGEGERVPAQIIPLIELGEEPQTARTLLVTIPPRAGAGKRQFRVQSVSSAPPLSESSFRWAAIDKTGLGLWEGNRPVLVYNHQVLSKPGVPADRNRSTYVHPIHGLDGEILTDDFPKDHYHHRGLFWAWPHVRIDGARYDLWDIRGIHQRFGRWRQQVASSAGALLTVENGWDIGEKRVMHELVSLTVFPKNSEGQMIDVDLTWIPVDQPIALAGAEDKSYGGLTLRFAPRTGTVITTPLGDKSDDLAMTSLAWADLSARFAGSPVSSGAAIFISPAHPDYPPTWLTRHYGALCVGWPGVTAKSFRPGERIHCRYRLWIHRETPTRQQLARAYEGYRMSETLRWDR